MPTLTRTETAVRVERAPDGSRARVSTHSSGGPDRPTIRPVLLDSDAHGARISLVPEGALLLGGDAVRLDVSVGADAALQVTEPAGTVAYDMRGASATWEIGIDVAQDGTLIWHGEPFVLAAGSDTSWHATITLADGARLVLHETLVLGRHGERPGRLRHVLDVRRADGTPVLVDVLDLGPDSGDLLLGGRRVIGSTLLIGLTDDTGGTARGTRFELDGGGLLVRSLADEMHRL